MATSGDRILCVTDACHRIRLDSLLYHRRQSDSFRPLSLRWGFGHDLGMGSNLESVFSRSTLCRRAIPFSNSFCSLAPHGRHALDLATSKANVIAAIMSSPSLDELASQFVGRYGVVIVRSDGKLIIRRRWFPSWPSLWDQWLDNRWRRLPSRCVKLYFNQPRSCPGFLVLAYAQAGPDTKPSSLQLGLSSLDAIARKRNLRAIVCHATNKKLTDRVMRYFGYERHAANLRGRHYIRRIR